MNNLFDFIPGFFTVDRMVLVGDVRFKRRTVISEKPVKEKVIKVPKEPSIRKKKTKKVLTPAQQFLLDMAKHDPSGLTQLLKENEDGNKPNNK